MKLSSFSSISFDRGASTFQEAMWMVISAFLFSSWLPGSSWRCSLLRLFGARVGTGVTIKANVRIKFPWRLEIGDNCWVGEGAWIDNLAQVTLAHDVCISQDAYLCTGSHDWGEETFDLITKPIEIEAHVWVGARANIAPGSHMAEGSVLTLGSVASNHLESWTIYTGTPAVAIKRRPRPDYSTS